MSFLLELNQILVRLQFHEGWQYVHPQIFASNLPSPFKLRAWFLILDRPIGEEEGIERLTIKNHTPKETGNRWQVCRKQLYFSCGGRTLPQEAISKSRLMSLARRGLRVR